MQDRLSRGLPDDLVDIPAPAPAAGEVSDTVFGTTEMSNPVHSDLQLVSLDPMSCAGERAGRSALRTLRDDDAGQLPELPAARAWEAL